MDYVCATIINIDFKHFQGILQNPGRPLMTPYWRCVTLRHITLQGSQTRGNVRSAVESTRFHDKKKHWITIT